MNRGLQIFKIYVHPLWMTHNFFGTKCYCGGKTSRTAFLHPHLKWLPLVVLEEKDVFVLPETLDKSSIEHATS